MATGYSQTWVKQGSFKASLRLYYSTVYDPATNSSAVTVVPQFMSSVNYGNDYRFYNYGVSGAGIYGNGALLYSLGSNYGSGNYLKCGVADNLWATLSPQSGSIASFRVAHDDNGDASFTLGILGSARAMYGSGVLVSPVGAAAGSVITIHEAVASTISSCSGSVATQGNFLLSVSRLSSKYFHRASFSVGGVTLYTSEPFATDLSCTIPRSWFSSHPSASSLTVAVSVQTYTDAGCGSAVGSPAAASFTLVADAGMKPSVSAGWASVAACNTGAVENIAGFVKGYSQAAVTFDVSHVSLADTAGASVASFSVSCQGATVSASPYRTPVLTQDSLVCTVTDTRGRTASESFTVALTDYAPPVLSGICVFRCDSLGAADEDGTYYSAKATLSYSPLAGQNSCSLEVAHKTPNGSYGTALPLVSGTARYDLGPILADRSYTVKISAVDSLGGSAEYYATIPTRKWAMHFRPDGSGAAFGKAAETDGRFEVSADWDVKLGRPLGISSGGTGADNAADARANLGISGIGLLDVYPVGSIYLSTVGTSPALLFGGTWTQIEDRFLLSAGQSYSAGNTGGESAHTLTVDEIPAHAHSHWSGSAGINASGGNAQRGFVSSTGKNIGTDNTGGGLAHNNMPPYLVVYMWERIA